jgi:hypothetical protein
MASATQMGCRLKLLPILFAAVMGAHAASYYVTVAGLGGEPDYDSQFAKWALDLQHELEKNGPEAHIVTLSGPAATRDAIRKTLSRLATEMQPNDRFALFLIGHGSFDGSDYKLNLPGPDVTAAELASLMNRLPVERQLVVNMTSCSGASTQAFARKGRIVITATKSGTEKNATVFARYWIDALRDPAADTDKNGVLSTLELYRYTAAKTAAYFESEKLLATEHPTITDTGAAGAREAKAESGQGLLAARFVILEPEQEAARSVAPGKQNLVSKKEDLEARIDRLKYQKAALSPEDYKRQLSALLLELAQTQAEIDR